MKKTFNRSVEVGAFTIATLLIPGGVALLLFALHRTKEQAPGVSSMDIPAAASILAIGLIALVVGCVERALTKDIWAAQNRFPAEPWRWWKGWREGTVRPAFPRMVLAAALVAVLLLGCMTVGYFAGQFKPGSSELTFPQLLLIIVPCVMVSGWAGRRSWSWVRHRGVAFHMTTFPGIIGGTLEGTVCLPPTWRLGNEATLRLRCVAIQYRNRPKGGEERYEATRWEAERRINPALLGRDIATQGLPIYFRIPPEHPQSTPIPRHPDTVWRLQVKAPTSGSDIATEFDVPVFAAPIDLPTSAASDPLAHAEIRHERGTDLGLPAGLEPRTCAGGVVEYTLPPRRYVPVITIYLGAGVFVAAFTAYLISLSATTGLQVAHWIEILIATPLVFGSLYLTYGEWFRPRSLRVDGQKLTIRQANGPQLLSLNHREIIAIACVSRGPSYIVELCPERRATERLAILPSRSQAEAFAAQLRQALGISQTPASPDSRLPNTTGRH